MTDFVLLLPLIITGTGAILLMLLSAFEDFDLEVAAYTGMVFFICAFVAQLASGVSSEIEIFPHIFNGMLIGSSFSKVAVLIITGCGFFVCMSSLTYFKENSFCKPEYYSLVAFAACGMILLTMSGELITAFIALEIMSLAIYVLVGFHRTDVRATEAVLKYLMLGAFAGGFFCMGSALVYGGAGSTQFHAIGLYAAEQGVSTSPMLVVGFFLIIIALFFKVAAFPFHAWVVDVYDGASIPVTGFMATALKTAVFALFANLISINSGLQGVWIEILFYIAVFTMFAGNLIAIGQDNLKRMLAASGIVHTGYLLVALVAFTSKEFTGNVILFYLAAYAAGTLGMFAALSYLSGEGEKRQTFDDFRGLAKVRPYSAFAITVFLLSMAGIPPTAGFMGKLYIIINAINGGQVTLAVLAIVSSVLSMWYYLRLIIVMYFSEAREDFVTVRSPFAPVCTFILVICVFAISLIPIAV